MRASSLPAFLAPAFLVLACVLAAGAPARAEEQTPGFSVPPTAITPDEVAALSVDFDESFAAIENQYLADTLKLNYQISLLEKIVARQAELQKISESYAAMGVDFVPPPPSKGICAQLPANALCLKHYPELYAGLVDARKAHYEELERKAREAAQPERREGESDAELAARRKKEAEEQARIAAAKERENRYRWTEVSCLSGDCQGVLVTSSRDGFRATVRKGERLPDGTLIREITPRGIRVSIDGQAVNVRPAPGEGGGKDNASAAQAGSRTKAVADAAGAALGTRASAQETETAQAAAAAVLANASDKPGSAETAAEGSTASGASAGDTGNAGSTGQTMIEPALGPSGLF